MAAAQVAAEAGAGLQRQGGAGHMKARLRHEVGAMPCALFDDVLPSGATLSLEYRCNSKKLYHVQGSCSALLVWDTSPTPTVRTTAGPAPAAAPTSPG